MWHQQREQEKSIRHNLINISRRAQRRSEHYARIKADPTQFVQVHASRSKIFVDPMVAKQADDITALRSWQGDASVKIDRFDVRSHLDFLPPVVQTEHVLTDEEDALERRICYERYKILVANEFEKIHEERFLKSIYVEERFGKAYDPKLSTASNRSLVKAEEVKKNSPPPSIAPSSRRRKLRKSTSASTSLSAVKQSGGARIRDYKDDKATGNSDSDSSDEDVEEMETWDVMLDIKTLRPDQCRTLNKISHKYGMEGEDFVKFLWADREELDQRVELKKLDDAKAQFVGRAARRERQALKESKILLLGKTKVNPSGATTTLLSFKKNRDVEMEAERKQRRRLYGSGSDQSASEDSQDGIIIGSQPEFITSFGGDEESKNGHHRERPGSSMRTKNDGDDDEEDEEDEQPTGVAQGPQLPPNDVLTHMQKVEELKRIAAEKTNSDGRRGRGSRRWTRSRSRSKSPIRSRRRSSRSTSRSRSRSRERRRRRRSSSRSGSSRSRSRSRSRSATRRHRPVRRRSRSAVSSSRCRSASRSPAGRNGTNRRSVSSRSRSRSYSRSRSRNRSGSASSKETHVTLLDMHSSDSDSEQERKQVENRRRRIQATTKGLRIKTQDGQEMRKPPVVVQKPVSAATLAAREKLRLQTQKVLKRTYAKDKADEIERREMLIRKQMERDDELRDLAYERRARQRAERHRQREEENERSGASKRRRSRSGSRSRSRNTSRRSRSRSRSSRRRHGDSSTDRPSHGRSRSDDKSRSDHHRTGSSSRSRPATTAPSTSSSSRPRTSRRPPLLATP